MFIRKGTSEMYAVGLHEWPGFKRIKGVKLKSVKLKGVKLEGVKLNGVKLKGTPRVQTVV
jgi:hypothetical protein